MYTPSARSIRNLVALAVCLTLSACGGGGSSGGPDPSQPAPKFAIGGTVSGLTGTVVLQNNAGDDLTVTTNGAFRFATSLTGGGTAYRVTVKTHPANQTCTPTNDTGTVNTAPITNVQVTCASASFTIAGNVTGLQGSGLILQNNGRDDVTIAASGDQTFRFATTVAGGAQYAVTVLKQPIDPVQRCTVENGEGTASDANVPTPAVHCETQFSRFAYVADSDANTVSVYSVDSTTGQLRHRSFVTTLPRPASVAIDEANKWALVVNSTQQSISVFAINRNDGSLTFKSKADTGNLPWYTAIDPSGKFVYVINTTGSIWAYSLSASGVLTEVDANKRPPTGVSPIAIAIDCIGGKFLYVLNQESSTVSRFTVSRDTGELTPQGETELGRKPRFFTIDPANKFLYVVNRDSSDISIFKITDSATGTLEPVADSPLAVGAEMSNLEFDPSGRLAFVVADHKLIAYHRASDGSGKLTNPTTIDVGDSDHFVSTDALGKFVYVTRRDTKQIETFSIHADTGVLERVSQVASWTNPSGIVLSKGAAPVKDVSKMAYVLDDNNDSLSAYPFDPDQGLKPKLVPSAPTGPAPAAIALDPRGRFVFVTNLADAVSSFFINGLTGALSPGPVALMSGGPDAIAVDQQGRFAYVTNPGIQEVARLRIDPDSGELLDPTPFAAGTLPMAISLDPTGRFAYVANLTGHSMSIYQIDAASGALSPQTQLTTARNVRALVVDPSGRFVFDAERDSTDNVASFAIDPLTGLLTRVGETVTAGAQPDALAVAPSGRFLYAVNADADHPGIFRIAINTATGVLQTDPREFPLSQGIVPGHIVIDASGTFLYVVEGDAGGEIFRLDPVTGDLSAERVGQFATGANATSIVISSATQ